MESLALIGLQWGDEGKGKLVDWLSARFDMDVRYQGGPNAGHTVVVNGKKWVFQQMPAGILNPGIKVAIAAGCVLHPDTLFDEWAKLDQAGVKYLERTMIDSKVHIILPHHILLDRLRDEVRGKNMLGTTAKGIGPCYEEKHARLGIRVGDILSPKLQDRVDVLLDCVNPILKKIYGQEPCKKEKILTDLNRLADHIAPLICDVSSQVGKFLEDGKKVIFEGAQGVMLDLDHGSYPYVTSSHPGSIGIPAGVGISPKSISKVIGLTKAYATRVGAGPFPTEATGAIESQLQEIGNEFGATTGRRRRCGWLDLPLLRYAVRLNGVDGLAITKLDVLDSFDVIKFCTSYRKSDGSVVKELGPWEEPGVPIYEEVKGWKFPSSKADSFEELPGSARSFLERISTELGIPIWLISVGEEREATITLPDFPF